MSNFTYTVSLNGSSATIDLNYTKQFFGYDMEYIVLTFTNKRTTVDTAFNFEIVDEQQTFFLHGREVDSNKKMLKYLGIIVFIAFLM